MELKMWRPGRDRLSLGRQGEKEAFRFLESRGYTILETNYRTRSAEIDIIAAIDTWLCFIEVKTRKSLTRGRPSESITPAKQRKIIQGAMAYIKKKDAYDLKVRFDVVEVFDQNPGFKCHLIQHAFDAGCQ